MHEGYSRGSGLACHVLFAPRVFAIKWFHARYYFYAHRIVCKLCALHQIVGKISSVQKLQQQLNTRNQVSR